MSEFREEEYSDVEHIEQTEYASIDLDSELLFAELIADDSELEMGLTVHRDDTLIAISAGSISESSPRVSAYHALTIDQARQLGKSLLDVADKVEELQEENDEQQQEPESLLQKLTELGRSP